MYFFQARPTPLLCRPFESYGTVPLINAVVFTLSIHAVVLGLQPRQLLLTAIHISTIVIYKGLSFWLIYIVQKLGIAMVVGSGHEFGVLCILHAAIWFLGMYIIY